MQDVPVPDEEGVNDANAEQHPQSPPIDALGFRATRIQSLHLDVETESEQEGEDGVGLVGEQPIEHIEQRQAQRRRRQRQQLLFRGHDVDARDPHQVTNTPKSATPRNTSMS
jgi:hypothetical protein